MMKKIIYTLVIASLLSVGCKSSRTDHTKPEVDVNGTRIAVAVSGIGSQSADQGSNFAPSTRAAGGPGHIMVDIADFASTKLALYGVAEKNDIQKWAKADRVIDTLEATVASDGSVIFTKADEYKYFPQEGMLTLYSIYPSPEVADSPVSIVDNAVDPVVATITVGKTFDKQYDILYGRKQNVSVAQAQGIQMEYEHVMAQLRFKISRDADVTGRLTKIVVRGVNKAQMGIQDKTFVMSTDAADSSDYIAYEGVPIEIGTEVQVVGVNPLLLLPGQASISQVTITVDGQEYTSYIPNTWMLAQGKINTATLQLNKFGVRINGEWEVQPWAKGVDHDGNLENNGKMVQVSTLLLDGSKNPYTAVAPTFADIEIDGGYTHKGIAVKSVSGGVLVTEKFNTGVIHDEPLSLTALKLYTGATYPTATTIFDAKLINGRTLGGKRVIIDTLDNGRIKLEKNSTTLENYNINMLFGGFGDGTASIPYEVGTVATLCNVTKFTGSITTSSFNGTIALGGYFVQVADIDLTGLNFAPISVNSVSYDGNGYAIYNLNISSGDYSGGIGLFGSVDNSLSELREIKIESGSITYTGATQSSAGVASIVGKLTRGRVVNCLNKASVNATVTQNAGGIAGDIRTSARIYGCANFGQVQGRDIVGGIIGSMGVGCEMMDCYNSGAIVQYVSGSYNTAGGLIGVITTNTSNVGQNCYTVGSVISTDATYSGSVFGFAKSANRPKFSNNYVLTGAHAKITGNDKSTAGTVTSSVTVKTDVELKETTMVDALNAGRAGADAMWKEDVAPYINNGYPILIWQ